MKSENTPSRSDTSARGPRVKRRVGRPFALSLCLLGAALLLVHEVWWATAMETALPVLPPAGEEIEGQAPFRFAAVGDSRCNSSVFEEVLARIRNDGASLILHLGDIVHECRRQEFDWVLHELAEEDLAVPFCPVPGNHDITEKDNDNSERYRLYNRAFGQRRYWFAFANTLFVAFDNSTETSTPEDLDWLDRTLRRHRDGYEACFVYKHVPPRDPRPARQHTMAAGGPELMAILKKHRVSAVFASHIHGYLEDNLDGIPMYISGGAGAALASFEHSHHYLLCTVRPGGSFLVERKDVGMPPYDDWLEYVVRVKFPAAEVRVAAGLLLVAGLLLLAFAGARTERSAGKPSRGQDSSCDGTRP